ncbi:hypothetical protein OQA88_6050 [Cercophora sp. LCS_1]
MLLDAGTFPMQTTSLCGGGSSDDGCDDREVETFERARQREIAAYLSAASFPTDTPTGFAATPVINKDATLNALVQLGALRLDCDRSFLSLIDHTHQFVACEMTRSHSISEMLWDGDDRIFLGVAKLDAASGVCPVTMKAFLDETGEWARNTPNIIGNRTRYIICNFRTDPMYAERPYVKNFPYFGSYLEVPLITRHGWLLGSYCVVDNRPRPREFFDNDATVKIMADISAAIMNHLENVRQQQMGTRSDKLVRCLSEYISSEPTDAFPSSQNGLTIDPAPARPTVSSTSGMPEADEATRPTPSSNVVSASSIESSVSVSSTGNEHSIETPLTSLDEERDHVLGQPTPEENVRSPSPPISSTSNTTELHGNGFISSANIKSAFYRAASTIRHAMDLDGIMFLDAAPSSYIEPPSPSDNRGGATGPFCPLIVSLPESSQPRLPETALQRLIGAYTRGTILSADEFGPIEDIYGPGQTFPGLRPGRGAAQNADVEALFQLTPSARYVLFLPLWHFQRECWYAAAVGWVSDPHRGMDSTVEINLLAAFSNSIIAEVSRMETLAVSRSKSNFVSSISHELRSPLHGILASSELLRASTSDPSLLSTLDMLDSCGRTLLDTFTSLLDHALAIKRTKRASPSANSGHALVDLQQALEDVVETVHFSFLSDKALQRSIDSRSSDPTEVSKPKQSEHDVLVSVNVAREDWHLPIDVGAYKRIVMNLVGNSLKYTRSGRIEVGLKIVRRPDTTSNMSNFVCLTVEDTGRGMSSDFIKYRLFTPFSQEDSYSPGIGLGLSICQQLAIGLGGTIGVKSSVGVGTLVEVCLPFTRPVESSSQTDAAMAFSSDVGQRLRGKTACLIHLEGSTSSGNNPGRSNHKITEQALRANIEDSFGMKLIVAESTSPPPADIYFVKVNGSANALPPVFPTVFLCSGSEVPTCTELDAVKGRGVHLHHPIIPRRLSSALLSALEMEYSCPDLDLKSEFARQVVDDVPTVAVSPEPLEGPSVPKIHQQPESQLQPQALSIPPAPTQPVPVQPKLRILVVDDNPINVRLLGATLRKLEYPFAAATNGLEAVEQYKKSVEEDRQFTTVFMDITMPVMDGFEAIRRIRRLESEKRLSRCHIAALTGLSSESSRQEALASGSDLFLTKPVKMDAVKRLLDDQLGQGKASIT